MRGSLIALRPIPNELRDRPRFTMASMANNKFVWSTADRRGAQTYKSQCIMAEGSASSIAVPKAKKPCLLTTLTVDRERNYESALAIDMQRP